jgi:hypothetical protein
VVRTIVAGTWAYDVELELSLIKKATGERRFLDFRLLEVLQTTGAANLLEIDLPELASQEYVLEIVARESQTGTESRAHTSFRVR